MLTGNSQRAQLPDRREVFTLKVFGGLSLEGAGVPLSSGARQRRRLALLSLLAVAGGRGLSRDRLQALLWPDSDADRARHALDQLVYTTRKALSAEVIVAEGAHLRLNPAILGSDVAEFDEAVGDGRWSAAVAAYGGPLLDGIHLLDDSDAEQWLESQRLRREREYHTALETLADAAQRSGDGAGALQWLRMRTESEPQCTPAALRLMEALAVAGDQCGAVQHAQRHAEVVRAVLGLEPDPAIAALAKRLAPAHVDPAAPALPAEHPPATVKAPPIAARVAVDRPEVRAHAASSAAGLREPAGRRRPRRAALAVLAMIGLGVVIVASDRINTDEPAVTVSALAGRAPASEAAALSRLAETAWNRRTEEGLEEAVVLFRRAAERDPSYAPAYAGLARSYAMLGYFGFAPGDAMFPKAKAAALRSLELDGSDGGAWAALGQALAWEHAWEEAERAHRRAIEVAPDNATAHQWYALLLAYMGRSREAALHTGHASRLDPLSVQINNMYATMLYHAGDLDSALAQFRRTVEDEPDSAWVRANPWVLDNYASVLAAAGQYEEAKRLVARAREVVPTHPRPLLTLAGIHIAAGEPERARLVFSQADTAHPHYTIYRGMLHARLGGIDSAFAYFNAVTEWPLPALVGLNSPRGSPALRADPRYAELRQRLELPPLPDASTSGQHPSP